MRHTCHAIGCEATVPPRMFMCARHWRMIPKAQQDELWAAYVPGQENRKDPTIEYLDVARRLQVLVADRERVTVPPGIRARAERGLVATVTPPDEDDDGMADAVNLAKAELDAEVIEERTVRGALVEPTRVGPKVTGRRPPPPRGTP